MNPLVALILGAVLGGVLASGGEPKKDVSLDDSKAVSSETPDTKIG